MKLRVKICGITRPEDVEAALAGGADALGFVLWNGSPRRVTVAEILRLSLALPPFVARVGVFVDELRPVLLSAMRNGRLTSAQLHGDEDPVFASGLEVDWYRVFRVASGDDPAQIVEAIGRFGDRPFMLDTRVDAAGGKTPGGTGTTFDWALAAEVAARAGGPARMILAGGLTAGNVGGAVRRLRDSGLAAVDVSSGVEISPGRKDPERIRRFIDEVRSAE